MSNNNKLRAKLLIEAAELLNEGGGSRKTKFDRKEKEKEFYIDKQKEMPVYDKFKKIQEYDPKGSEREEYAHKMYHKELSYGNYSDSDKIKQYKNHEKNAEKIADSDFNKHRNKILEYDAQRAHDISEKSKRSLDKFYDSVKSYEKDIKDIHDKTKSKYDKLVSKNESVATLLIETAELLNESSSDIDVNESKNYIKVEKNAKITSDTSIDKFVDDAIDDIEKRYNEKVKVYEITGYDTSKEDHFDAIGCKALSLYIKDNNSKNVLSYLKNNLNEFNFKFSARGENDGDDIYWTFSLKVIGNKYYYQTYGETDYTDEQHWGQNS